MPLLLSQFAVTCFLTGLIWTIQVVHYPLMAKVGASNFTEYERLHANWITPLVGPAMLAELAAAFALVALRPRAVPAWAAWTALGLGGKADRVDVDTQPPPFDAWRQLTTAADCAAPTLCTAVDPRYRDAWQIGRAHV